MMMSKYTISLRELLDDPLTKEKIDKALSTYPIYISKSEEKNIPNVIPTREVLNEKLLNYYKYREIGFETIGRFIDELEIAMKEIMPYYNQLMHTMDLDYNIIYNVNYEKTIKRDLTGKADNTSTNSGTSESSSTATSKTTDTTNTESTTNSYSKNVETQTPQDNISKVNTEIDSVDYADKITWNHNTATDSAKSNGSADNTSTSSSNTTSNTTGTSSGTNSENEEMVEITKGNYGQVSYQALIDRYRGLILNIEQDIINDRRIKELFMMVY